MNKPLSTPLLWLPLFLAASLLAGCGALRFSAGQSSGQMPMTQAIAPTDKVALLPVANFTDVPQKYVSLINLASVRDIERVAGMPVDPLRFRGNIHVEGLEPWIEKSWTGRTLAIGPVRATVAKQIVRCAATNVNPATAERDMRLPQLREVNKLHAHR